MANLTPEQLAMLQRMMQQGGQAEYFDPAAGRAFMPNNGSGWAPGSGGYSGQDGYQGSAPTEFRGYEWAPGMYSDNFEMNGTQYDKFNAQGENTGQGTWEGLKKNSAMDTLLPFAMAGLPFALTAMGVGAGYGALGATEPVASIGATGGMTQAELAAMGAGGSGAGLGGSGAFLGEGVASGVPAWDAAATGAGLSLSGAAGGAGLLGGASKWLGPAATLLGAAAGAKGQESSQTQSRDIPEWLKPSVMGLLGMTNDKLAQQMAPGALAGYDDMQRVGRGLLGAPVAGNGFSLFRGR